MALLAVVSGSLRQASGRHASVVGQTVAELTVIDPSSLHELAHIASSASFELMPLIDSGGKSPAGTSTNTIEHGPLSIAANAEVRGPFAIGVLNASGDRMPPAARR